MFKKRAEQNWLYHEQLNLHKYGKSMDFNNGLQHDIAEIQEYLFTTFMSS